MNKKSNVVTGLALIVLLGAVFDAGRESVATASPTASPTPTPTASPTPTPTPRPTASPTPRPTPTPAIGSAEFLGWTLHVFEAQGQFVEANDTYIAALQRTDIEGSLEAVFAYIEFVQQEADWQLDIANIPARDACYYDAWDAWTDFLIAELTKLLSHADWLITLDGEPDMGLADESLALLEQTTIEVGIAQESCAP